MSIYKTLFEKPENKFKTGIIGMIIITAILAGVFRYEANAIEVTDLSELQDIILKGSGNMELTEMRSDGTETGYTNEESESDFTINIQNEMLVEVSCTLNWEDEPPSYFRGTNEPDEFSLTLIAPNGEIVDEAGPSMSGPISVSSGPMDYEEEDFVDNYVGPWRVVVAAGVCGDQFAIGGFRSSSDDGNDWTASYSYSYMEEVETETD
jgi:hypothetical protein